MPKQIHAIAGACALLMITGFWLSSAWAELFGDTQAIVAVKLTIPWALLALVPAMALAGAGGMRLGRGWRGRRVGAKRRRMPVIAANGLLVLVPVALYLAAKARAGELDGWFFAAQALEFVAGAVNITLLGFNMRDGVRLSRGRVRPGARA